MHDADDVRLSAWVPAHLLAREFFLDDSAGTVTAWSAQFSCPLHGECTEEMVSTAKTCAIPGSRRTILLTSPAVDSEVSS